MFWPKKFKKKISMGFSPVFYLNLFLNCCHFYHILNHINLILPLIIYIYILSKKAIATTSFNVFHSWITFNNVSTRSWHISIEEKKLPSFFFFYFISCIHLRKRNPQLSNHFQEPNHVKEPIRSPANIHLHVDWKMQLI